MATASIALDAPRGTDQAPRVGAPVSGTISSDITMAPGTLMIEAISRWPTASGTTGPRIVAYSISTVPAIVAMPEVSNTNSSLVVNRVR